MTVGEYVTHSRLTWFIKEVRKPGATATRVAYEAGYESYHSLLDALKRTTGLAPTDVRGLSHDEIQWLLAERLEVSNRASPSAKLTPLHQRVRRVLAGSVMACTLDWCSGTDLMVGFCFG
jgi:hypothetical protein